jgi:plastocyanin
MRRLAAPCAALLLLAGCDGDAGEGGGRTVTVKGGGTLRVTAKEYSFDPARVVVEGRGQVRIELKNAGSLAHNLRLTRGGSEVGGTPTFRGDRTESGRVRVRPGTYRFLCTVGDHAELGMRGEMEVK